MESNKGINVGLVIWAAVLTFFTGLLGLAIAIFGEKPKRRDRLIGVGASWAVWIVIIIIAAAAGGSSSNSKSAAADKKIAATPTVANAANVPSVAPATSAPEPTSPPAPTAAPTKAASKYKLRVSKLTCSDDSGGIRECTGTVTNIQADKNATDISPVVHWTGGTDSDYGTVDINPLLPGQSSSFTVFTLHPNPRLTQYTIGFKKTFGSEDDYPVDPTPAD